MCERDGSQILEETTTNECKCQSSFNTNNRLQQQPQANSHHSTKNRKSNVNMQQQQQHQQQQISHMEMSFPNNNLNSLVAPNNNPSGVSISSLDSFVNSYTADSGSSCSSFSSCTSNEATTSTASPSIGVNLRVTGQCSQGGRKYMEDYFSVAYQQSENAKDLEYAFIGIYDGHGGAEAARFAKEHLMMEIINQKLFWSDSDRDVLRAIREGYIATHYAMWNEQEKWPKTANGLLSTAGTTATIAFIRREKIYIGHVGDSGIVLGYQNENENFWRAKQLTTDHKPESFTERARIMRSGGKVVIKSGVPRVVWNRPRNAGHKGPIRRSTPIDEVPFLAVARSLGDLWSYNSALNEFVVSPDPDVKVIKINPKTFRCLIFGTDGLWNVVTPQEAVNSVFEKETINECLQAQRGDSTDGSCQWTNPSKGLVEKALKTWSAKKMRADNTSVVTVILYPPGNGETAIDTGENGAICSTESTLENNTSYGLEYMQMGAEISLHDCVTSYHDMADKYLPPEEYRNFNYYEDENEHNDEKKPMPTEIKYSHSGILEWRNDCDKINHTFPTDVYPWSWIARQQMPTVWHGATEMGVEAFAHEHDNEQNEEVNAENAENVVEHSDEDNDEDEAVAEHEPESTVTNYTHYISDTSTSLDTSSTSEHTETNYTNSFAESYNSLLNEQMSQEANSSSNSNPSYHSVHMGTGPGMLAILQEQQLYQQQCMSEEEGYSLTKLETRREQQRCTSGVQTFKIFQQNQEAGNERSDEESDEKNLVLERESAEQSSFKEHEWEEEPRTPVLSTSISRFILDQQQQQQRQQVQQPKPLELDSLLQRELEEEQQVALEQMEMQRKLVDATTESSTSHNLNCSVALHNIEDDALVEEYLDEEITIENDETVQINEVSSSSTIDNSCPIAKSTDSSSSTEENNKFTSNFEKQPVLTEQIECIEKIEKIEILQDLVSTVQHESKPLRSTSTIEIQTQMLCTKRVPAKHTYFHNIPNENQRSSVTASSHSLMKRSRLEPFAPLITKPVTVAGGSCRSGGGMEKRQLRSSGIVDYSKRTLRTRNSLAKDMKAKKTQSSSFKRPSSHMLRKTLVEQRQQQHSCSGNNNNNINGSSRSKSINNIKKTKTGKLPLLKSSTSVSDLTNAINLRSRRIGQLTAAVKTTVGLASVPSSPPPNHRSTSNISNKNNNSASTSSAIKRSKSPVLRRERENLRTKQATKIISSNSNVITRSTPPTTIPTNFSKSTRMQSSVNTFTLQPPSPKLMNSSVAAVAAATRARSLLTKNSLAAKNFSKRVSLRNNQCNATKGVASTTDISIMACTASTANVCRDSSSAAGAAASITRGSCRIAKKRRGDA